MPRKSTPAKPVQLKCKNCKKPLGDDRVILDPNGPWPRKYRPHLCLVCWTQLVEQPQWAQQDPGIGERTYFRLWLGLLSLEQRTLSEDDLKALYPEWELIRYRACERFKSETWTSKTREQLEGWVADTYGPRVNPETITLRDLAGRLKRRRWTRWATQDELARALDIHRNTLKKHMDEGLIDYQQQGRQHFKIPLSRIPQEKRSHFRA
jgi:hypothetical protein